MARGPERGAGSPAGEVERLEAELASARRAVAEKDRALGEQQALLAEQGKEILALAERLRGFEQGGALPPVLPLRYRIADRLNDTLKRFAFLRRLHAWLKDRLARRMRSRRGPP